MIFDLDCLLGQGISKIQSILVYSTKMKNSILGTIFFCFFLNFGTLILNLNGILNSTQLKLTVDHVKYLIFIS